MILDNKQALNFIKKSRWQEWGTRRVTTRLAENWTGSTAHFRKFFGLNFPDQLSLLKDEVAFGYLRTDQFENLQKQLIKKLLRQNFEDFYEKKAKPQFRGLLKYSKKVAGLKLSQLSKEKISRIYEEYVRREDLFMNILWVIFALDFCLPFIMETELKSYLKKAGKAGEFNKYLKIILSPIKRTDSIRQGIDTLRAAVKIGHDLSSKEAAKEIDKLVSRYSYFPMLNFDEKPLAKEYFLKEIKKFKADKSLDLKKKLNSLNVEFAANKKQYKKITAEIKSNQRLTALVQASHGVAFYRDYRNEVRRKYGFYIAALYREIARRLNIPLNQVLMMTRAETKDSLEANRAAVSEAEILKRKKGCAIALIDNELYYYFSENIYKELISLTQTRLSLKEFKGLSASPGKVKGRAKLIISVKTDGHKLKQGDVLVTSMTNLDFVPLLSKVSAIITDEGSQLCHAAIISRELGIPCIVGAKIATKVLRDGDLVEVDAERGVVRKIVA